MAVVPIGTYFATLKYFTKGEHFVHLCLSVSGLRVEQRMSRERNRADMVGSTTISAICAIITANMVLVGYVIVAFREDMAYPSTSTAVREKFTEKKLK
jgi:hypothetical protein